jgi:hypothetical protein
MSEARQPRHLVEAGIVLHRAGAEREEPGVDAVVLLAEAHIVAHRLGLGETGQADLALAGMLAEARRTAGASMSTPVASRWPISKISGSICWRPCCR